MTSSPRNEKSSAWSASTNSRSRASDRSITRSRAGCPRLYRPIVESVCASVFRKREASMGSVGDGLELPRHALRAECLPDLGIGAPDGDGDDLLDIVVVRPIGGERGKRRQHLRRLVTQLPFAEEASLLGG